MSSEKSMYICTYEGSNFMTLWRLISVITNFGTKYQYFLVEFHLMDHNLQLLFTFSSKRMCFELLPNVLLFMHVNFLVKVKDFGRNIIERKDT